MKTINDLKLSKKAKAIVKTWLDEWLNMFIAQANGREGTVHRADFVKDDFFYFTDCTDILSKDPEAKGIEGNLEIRSRKRKVLLQLFVKHLLGTLECKKIKCSHCGYSDRYIGPLSNRTGHFLYCPKCFYTTIATYPAGYPTCIDDIKNYRSRNPPEALEDSMNNFAKALSEVQKIVNPTEKAKKQCEKYAMNCGACCKDTPQCKRSCENCKYGPHNDRTKVCHTCIDSKNWKSKECICGDDCQCEEPKLPKEPPLMTVPRFLEKSRREKKCKN